MTHLPDKERDPGDFRTDGYRHSFRCAWDGIRHMWRTQRNFRTHIIILVLVAAAGIYFHLSREEWLIILLTSTLMLLAEGLNTAIEEAVNLFSDNRYHPTARIAKDVAAASCLLTACFAVLIGLVVFVPKILNRPGF